MPDVSIAMGQTAENVATSRGVSRERQDEWGVTSQNRAQAAIEAGATVATIEAMKMEAGITTPVAGRVVRAAIGTHQQVEGGDLLVVVEG